MEFEADQRLVEALVHGLQLEDGNTASSPGTKPKPISKQEQQGMMEKRLRSIEGGNCTIANLKAMLGQMKVELKEAKEKLAELQGSSREECQEEGTVEATEAEGPGICSEENEEGSEMLTGAAMKTFQTQAARANYLCLDRPDIGFATKECMRRLSAPTEADMVALKKLGRYLRGRPRVVSVFKYCQAPCGVIIEGDSDHAGCTRTRKSTTGGVIRCGTHFEMVE